MEESDLNSGKKEENRLGRILTRAHAYHMRRRRKENWGKELHGRVLRILTEEEKAEEECLRRDKRRKFRQPDSLLPSSHPSSAAPTMISSSGSGKGRREKATEEGGRRRPPGSLVCRLTSHRFFVPFSPATHQKSSGNDAPPPPCMKSSTLPGGSNLEQTVRRRGEKTI